jgi:PAS domain S-box-containing protein
VDSLPLPDGRTAATGEERVLLTFGGTRDRELLRSWLDDEFEVVEGTPDEVMEFDLCLVDEANYAAFESTLAARREAATPAFLPVLVLATEPRAVPDHADDVVVMPTRTELLGSRVRSLLRTRRLTRELSLFRRAMDAATVGVCITRAGDDQPILYINDAFIELTGHDREAALGRNCRFLQGEDTDPEAVAELRAAVEEGRTATVVLRNYRADGTPFWNRVSVMPVREGGEVTHFAGFQRDVTRRIERQRELEQHEAVVRSMREAAWVIDPTLHLAFVNPQVAVPDGWSAEEMVGQHISAFRGLFPDEATRARYRRYVDEILAGEREEAVLTFEAALSDGPLAMEVTLAPMVQDGEIDGVLGLSRDVSERVERDRRISVLDRVLRHNLRNKLNVVLANAEDLTDAGDADTVRLAADIEAAAAELLDLSDTARRFETTIRPGEGTVTFIDVAAQVAHVVEEAELVHDAEVELALPERAEALAHESLELAVEELVENAIVHADGDPSVSVVVTDRPEAGVVEVAVVDEGPGLPEMERAVLSRGAETPLEHMEGLGLWFANWTVAASGGSVTVADNEPRGTAVTISLPRAAASLSAD